MRITSKIQIAHSMLVYSIYVGRTVEPSYRMKFCYNTERLAKSEIAAAAAQHHRQPQRWNNGQVMCVVMCKNVRMRINLGGFQSVLCVRVCVCVCKSIHAHHLDILLLVWRCHSICICVQDCDCPFCFFGIGLS